MTWTGLVAAVHEAENPDLLRMVLQPSDSGLTESSVIREVLTWFARRRRKWELVEARKAFALGQADERRLLRVIAGAIERGEGRVAALREQLENKRRANRVLETRVEELETALAELRRKPGSAAHRSHALRQAGVRLDAAHRAVDKAQDKLDADLAHTTVVKRRETPN